MSHAPLATSNTCSFLHGAENKMKGGGGGAFSVCERAGRWGEGVCAFEVLNWIVVGVGAFLWV
jgi:hypothetical protein